MNALVVVANGLQVGSLGCYGNEWIRTPALDRFATQSMVFDQCFVESPQTLAVHRSWWTGRYANPSSPDFHRLPSQIEFAESLRAAGVRTGFVSDSWTLREAVSVASREPRGLSPRLFDDVLWVRGQGCDPYVSGDETSIASEDLSHWQLVPEVLEEIFRGHPDDHLPEWDACKVRLEQALRNRARVTGEESTPLAEVVGAGLDWVHRHASRGRFLLWMECSDPHAPWSAPEPYLDLYQAAPESASHLLADPIPGVVGEAISEEDLETLRRAYAASVTFVDTWLGRFFEQLESEGYLDETLVLVVAGHGVSLGEHDRVGYVPPRVLEEMVHVPLLLRLPGAERGGTRSQALVQSPDLAPTLLDLFGQGAACGATGFHGGSLLPLARGESAKLRDYAVSWVRNGAETGEAFEEWSLRTHLWHLVLPVRGSVEGLARPSRQLFIKPEDPWDHRDVADQYLDAADQLELALRRFEGAVEHDDLESVAQLRQKSLLVEE